MSSLVLNDRKIIYGVNQLSSIDPILKRLFSGFDIPKLKIETNYVWSLCRSIIYQQKVGKLQKQYPIDFWHCFVQEPIYSLEKC